jgi:hypothetical protein
VDVEDLALDPSLNHLSPSPEAMPENSGLEIAGLSSQLSYDSAEG